MFVTLCISSTYSTSSFDETVNSDCHSTIKLNARATSRTRTCHKVGMMLPPVLRLRVNTMGNIAVILSSILWYTMQASIMAARKSLVHTQTTILTMQLMPWDDQLLLTNSARNNAWWDNYPVFSSQDVYLIMNRNIQQKTKLQAGLLCCSNIYYNRNVKAVCTSL